MEGLEALALGGLAQSSLLLAGLAVYWVHPTTRVIGGLAGFGAGALVAAVAFDLIPEAEVLTEPELALWLLIGALIFVVADRFVESKFGDGDEGVALSASLSGRLSTACLSL